MYFNLIFFFFRNELSKSSRAEGWVKRSRRSGGKSVERGGHGRSWLLAKMPERFTNRNEITNDGANSFQWDCLGQHRFLGSTVAGELSFVPLKRTKAS